MYILVVIGKMSDRRAKRVSDLEELNRVHVDMGRCTARTRSTVMNIPYNELCAEEDESKLENLRVRGIIISRFANREEPDAASVAMPGDSDLMSANAVG